MVDALRGYHELGFALTGHAHWRAIKEERREAGAQSLARVIITLPAGVQASILVGLAWSSVALVSFEMFGAPVLASLKVKRDERKKAAEEKKAKEAAASGTGE